MLRDGRICSIEYINSLLDHGLFLGLGDDDHLLYIKDSEFTQDSGVLVGTGAGAFQEEAGDTLRTSLGLGTTDTPTFARLVLIDDTGAPHLQLFHTGSGHAATFLEDASGNLVIDSTGTQIRFENNVAITGSITTGDGGSTDYVDISAVGDIKFVGAAGLPYGEISARNAADTITITTAGIANKVQITSFDTNGASNNSTPDHTNDHITITTAGHYFCTISLHIESAGGGGADTFGFSVYKNNGTTEFANVHGHRKLAGGGGDVGSVSLSGIIDLAATDTVELWVWNEDSTDNLIVQDVTLSILQIGGT